MKSHQNGFYERLKIEYFQKVSKMYYRHFSTGIKQVLYFLQIGNLFDSFIKNQNQILTSMQSSRQPSPQSLSKDKKSLRKNSKYESSASPLVQEINQMINGYEKLKTKEDQEKCRSMLMNHILEELAKFQEKIDASKVDLKNLNLIVGTTGAGKSTLFNFLNDVPLIVSLKKSINKEGKVIERLEPVLLVDEQRVKKMKNVIYAPIGCGVQSETTIPNFFLQKTNNVAYVDCAGQFDSKDVIQSIVNSYFKYELAQKAEKVKLTIAFNYQALNIDRGTSFKKLMNQVGKFIGLWDQFVKSQSVSLVVTNAPRQQNLPEIIYSMLEQISENSKDLKQLKPLIQSIIQRKAVAFFYIPQRQQIRENGKKPKLGYKHGTVYERRQVMEIDGQEIVILSPQMIIKTLSKTKFMNTKQGLFKQNLQQKAQKKVDIICQDMLNQIKESILKAAMITMAKNSQKQQNKTEYYKKLQIQLKKCPSITQTIKILNIPEQLLAEYKKNLEGFGLFEKISNIVRVQQKMEKAKDSLSALVSDELNNLLHQDVKKTNEKLILIQEEFLKKEQVRMKQLKKIQEQMADEQRTKDQQLKKLIESLEKKQKKINKDKDKLKQAIDAAEKGPQKQKLQDNLKKIQSQQASIICQKDKVQKAQKLTVELTKYDWKEDYSATITVQNKTSFKIEELYVKHGCNRNDKTNFEFVNPIIAYVRNLAPNSNCNFQMKFLTERPSIIISTAKLFLPFTTKAWGKDYWEIEGVLRSNDQCRFLTTTKLDRWYSNVQKQDTTVTIQINQRNGDFMIQTKMMSGSSTREFVPIHYQNIYNKSWST